MGLTYVEAIRLGIGHLHPDHPHRVTREHRGKILPVPPQDPESDEPGMNRTERRFRDEVLEPLREWRHISSYRFQPLKVRLAGRTFFTPDYLVIASSPRERPNLIDVKGYLRDDAAVKIKVAASLFGEFRWLLAYRRRGTWEIYAVTDRGMATRPIEGPWFRGGSIGCSC